ncbi:ATP-binding protein [Tenacibaculum caenipelagi]|uniref:histidine kinase n=1 Tax=Tenacibaculum caenipelagi TaxID=1325435 RepID=A0A4V3D2W3_9FLAO|nr:tetratricopeptide repeat-containing sensor histidine kinase [Tenacibaculum caenipelagi]TDQ24055.1 signal transduction histidine kinase [Tenacibaculum caenipelagi]
MKKALSILALCLLISNISFGQENKLSLREKLSYIKHKDSLAFFKVDSLYSKQKYTEALDKALILLKESKINSNDLLSSKINNIIGNIYFENNSYQKAIEFYTISNKYFKKHKNKSPSLDRNKKLDLLPINDDDYIEMINLQKIGSSYHILKESDSINSEMYKDSAMYYYGKVINNSFKTEKAKILKAKINNNLSTIYLRDSLYKKAEFYINESIKLYESINDKVGKAGSLGNLANIYLEKKELEKSKATYIKALNLIKDVEDNNISSTKTKSSLYFNLAWTLYLLKDYTAYTYQEKSYNIKDDLRDIEIRRMIDEIYTQHELNLEKEKTALVEEQRKLKEAQQAKTSMLFGVLSLLVLIISGVIIYNYKLRQRNLRLKLSESKLIQQQNIEKLKSEAQVKILNATIDGKETERKLIAEILHDNVSALLSSANMHLSATKKQFEGETSQEIQKTQAIISEASQKVRDLSHNLVSSILLKFGLEYAIKDVAKKYSNSELNFKVSAQNISRYNQEFEIKIFNVIQELINNILKHSKAKHAQINLKEENNQLTVLVKDDGVGFSTSSSSFSDGIGLNQIEARIHVMNGKLTIKSKENAGTSVHIKVPILKQEKNIRLTSIS